MMIFYIDQLLNHHSNLKFFKVNIIYFYSEYINYLKYSSAFIWNL